MCQLSEEQVTKISERLKGDEIRYSHLFDDLLDHICCEIEEKLSRGIGFNTAYKTVFDKIGLNGLKEIQEATIFYVKLNLIVMKKVMNFMAVAGTVILAISFLFKINHWPGGSLLSFFGFLILFLGFFPVALLSIRKDLSVGFFSKKFGIYLIGFICLIETGAAILFKTMHWPGGTSLMLISWVLLILVFFPILFYNIIKSDKNKIANLCFAIFALIFLGTSIVSTFNDRVNPANTIEYMFITQDLDFFKASIDKDLKSTPKEKADSISNELLALNKSFDEIEQLVTKYQGIILNGEPDIYSISIKFNHQSEINAEYDNCFSSLKKAIDNYKSNALELSSNNVALAELITNKLSTDRTGLKDFDKIGMSWEKKYFKGSQISIYTGLQRILMDAYQVKYEIIKDLQH